MVFHHLKQENLSSTINLWVDDVRASVILGCSTSKLRQDRHKCRGIPYAKMGRSVRYSVADLEAFMANNRITPKQ